MVMGCLVVFTIGLMVGDLLINRCILRVDKDKPVVQPPYNAFSARHVMVDATTGVVFASLYYKYALRAEFFAFTYLMSILIAVLFIDIKHRIIPNNLVIAGLAGGVLVFIYNIHYPLEIYQDNRWWSPVLGILPGTGFLFLIAVAGMLFYKDNVIMGMGDVKIFAPVGLFLGWRMCILALIASMTLAGISSMVLVGLKLKGRKDTIPFGPFITAGTFIAIICGVDILKWYIK